MKAKIVICTLVLMFSAFAGSAMGDSSSTNNTFYGLNAAGGNYNTGEYNTFIGNGAGYLNAAGYSNTFIGNGAGLTNSNGWYNTFVGSYAGQNNTNGYWNTFIGFMTGGANTGHGNTFVGLEAGVNNNGNNNVFLGYEAGYSEPGSNKLYISNSDTSNPLIYGEFDNKIVTVNGSLGIGTSTPVRYLHLSGPNAVFRMDRTADTAAFQMVRTDGSGNPMKVFVVGVNASGPGTGEFIINDNGTALSGALNRRMTIANDGSVTFTGTVTAANYYSSSSLTLKDNVRTYENALDTVNRLRGVSFDWKDSGKPAVGLIAEEVAKVVPEVVAYNDGAAAGVNYASLVGVLVEAVKEQQGLIKDLQDKNSRLEQLEVKNEQLEQRLLALEGK